MAKKTNVSWTISVLVFRVLMYLESQSVSDTGLAEFYCYITVTNVELGQVYI
jgi:hypothetical protein